jgi:hypothetical protein
MTRQKSQIRKRIFAAFGPGGPQPRAAGYALSVIAFLSLLFAWVEDLLVRIRHPPLVSAGLRTSRSEHRSGARA